MARITRAKWKVFENVFDEFTLRVLFKLESQEHFDELKSPIAIGKEANVFTALKGDGLRCVKIYRLLTCDFNAMYRYIRNDPRFLELRKQRRKVIFAWAQREYRNLLKAREAGVRCPRPLAFESNCLVMDLIGEEVAAPLLKDAAPEDAEEFFKDLIKQMKLIHNAKIVHGDLSEYNILNHHEKPVLIDFSHGTPLTSPDARMLLERDIRNVCRYFTKQGVECSEAKVKEYIVSTTS